VLEGGNKKRGGSNFLNNKTNVKKKQTKAPEILIQRKQTKQKKQRSHQKFNDVQQFLRRLLLHHRISHLCAE